MSTSWLNSFKQNLKASKLKDKTSGYFTFSTLTQEGPRSRTVVLRDFLKDSELLVFTTHLKSDKVQEILKDNRTSLCFTLNQSLQQYRIEGKSHVISTFTDDQVLLELLQVNYNIDNLDLKKYLEEIFDKIPSDTRFWFENDFTGKVKQEGNAAGNPVDGLENFALVVVEPKFVDLVNLEPDNHTRFKFYNKNDDGTTWVKEEVYP